MRFHTIIFGAALAFSGRHYWAWPEASDMPINIREITGAHATYGGLPYDISFMPFDDISASFDRLFLGFQESKYNFDIW